ncbi:SANT/Myb_domain [Hexamita inflata]|uniref:SANT/Myb domain n=1 Tax=Hexamita inflata TaxID=28002 RepID=A0AA86QL81_9EUKA|nr:SANT/Myb domain [Hexamita inflata]CAI9956118.1 SANT/Myb domain [Hexamita inflata]CAI9956121.1 SANT/Myb domain [Hexamita inflata]
MKRYWNKWTLEEKRIFRNALKQFGKDFETISDLLQNRSYRQVRSHYYNTQSSQKQQDSQKQQNNYKKESYQFICYDTV